MIYLISSNHSLFNDPNYELISFNRALNELSKLKIVQLDSETSGLDAYTKRILCLQLGNKINQYVFDWASLTKKEKYDLKEYLESDRIFIGWNLAFDLSFLYMEDIYPENIWDGMIAEQLLFLGYPSGTHLMSLQSAAWYYLHMNLDKSVRGKIINVGLTSEVVIYAAGDVTYLEDIKEKQEIDLDKKDLQRALRIENEFIKTLVYIKHCGVKLDTEKWKVKMTKDNVKLREATSKLNKWVVDWSIKNPDISKGLISTVVYDLDGPEAKRLINIGYYRDPSKDTTNEHSDFYYGFSRRNTYKYADINYQGDLFDGFNTDPVCSINWSSSKQVIPLFEDLGFDLTTFDKKTKKKKKSVEAKIIEKQLNVSTIAPIYLKYQEAAKVVSTYGENWIKAINPISHRIHPDYKQLGTATARLSSGGGESKLNIQNIPHDAETRACFVADKGNAWISADYQSQESRIIASVSNDSAMIDLFENGCGDVHSLVAKMSYPDIIGDTRVEDIKDKFHTYRADAKGIEFSIDLNI